MAEEALVLASIIAHGLTDTVGTRWIQQRIQADPEQRDAEAGPVPGSP